MSKRVNRLMIGELGDFFQEMDPCVLINYIGISAEDATKMRTILREKDISLRVIKTSLSRIALKEAGRQDVADLIDGPTAMATGGSDPIVLAKAVAECLKGKTNMGVMGGFAEGQALTAAQVETFVKMPGREALLAQILAGISSPLTGVAGMFASVQRSLVTALKAIADQKAEQG